MISNSNIKNFIGKSKRFGLYIPLSNLMLVYGSRFFPKNFLDRVAEKRNRTIENKLEKILGKVEVSDCDLKETKDFKIWFLWLRGEENMPLIQRMCLQSIRKNSCGHEVVVLSLKNLDQYIEITDRGRMLFETGRIAPVNFADYVRIRLLSKYGGFWMDSTMYITKPIDEFVNGHRLFALKSKKEWYYVSECRWSSFCFYMNRSSKLPHLLDKMLMKYWDKEEWIIDYFLIDYLIDMNYRKHKSIKDDIDAIPFSNPNLHALTPLLCQDYDEENFNRLISDTSFFKLSWKIYTDEMLKKNKNNYYHKMLELAK